MNRVISDLALGVRLAVGGSRKSWARLALQGVGIGLGVALLLFAASLPSVTVVFVRAMAVLLGSSCACAKRRTSTRPAR